jgi:hypothetical protein
MRIEFTLGSETAEFQRNWFTGRAQLSVGGRTELLQEPGDIATHLKPSLTRTWRRTIGGHDIAIEKTRPLLVAGARPHFYRVLVDGNVVAETRGY